MPPMKLKSRPSGDQHKVHIHASIHLHRKISHRASSKKIPVRKPHSRCSELLVLSRAGPNSPLSHCRMMCKHVLLGKVDAQCMITRFLT